MTLEGFTRKDFTNDGETRAVYRRGEGPGVVVMPEIPGITPAVAAFAGRIADEGFTVLIPSLFGTPGRPLSASYAAVQAVRTCISREFHVLASRGSSPITVYLRALCRAAHEELGGKGVGAVGMCITGNFALALMVDPWVMAPVLSQPSLPLGLGRERRSGLHLSDADLACVKRRVAAGVPVLGMRFTSDPLVPAARFERLRAELGPGFEAIEIDSSPGNPHGIPRLAHSVVTNDLVNVDGHPTRAALDRVLSFLKEQLLD